MLKEYLEQDIDNPIYLFHGSPKRLSKLIPQQANDSNGNIDNIAEAIFLFPSFLKATPYSFKDTIKENSSELPWSFTISNTNKFPLMTMENVNVDESIIGYIYVFKKDDDMIKDENSYQYKCYKELIPVDVVEVCYKDFAHYYDIKNNEVIKMEVRQELVEFMEKEIFPIYDTFDKGHDMNHITAVIGRAMELYKFLDDPSINIDIVYAAAALHDIGISVERKNHALHSRNFVLNCEPLREFFTEDEINIVADAVADHSTSRGVEPRSIYGKIVCDADKDDDLETSLLRAYEYTKSYYPDFTEEQCLQNVYEQLSFKFGDEGKVKFWINSDKQEEFKHRMHELATDEGLFLKTMSTILEQPDTKISAIGKK